MHVVWILKYFWSLPHLSTVALFSDHSLFLRCSRIWYISSSFICIIQSLIKPLALPFNLKFLQLMFKWRKISFLAKSCPTSQLRSSRKNFKMAALRLGFYAVLRCSHLWSMTNREMMTCLGGVATAVMQKWHFSRYMKKALLFILYYGGSNATCYHISGDQTCSSSYR